MEAQSLNPAGWKTIESELNSADTEFAEIFAQGSRAEQAIAYRVNRIRTSVTTTFGELETSFGDLKVLLDKHGANDSIRETQVSELANKIDNVKNSVEAAFAVTADQLRNQMDDTDKIIKSLHVQFAELNAWRANTDEAMKNLTINSASPQFSKPIMEYLSIQGMDKLGKKREDFRGWLQDLRTNLTSIFGEASPVLFWLQVGQDSFNAASVTQVYNRAHELDPSGIYTKNSAS